MAFVNKCKLSSQSQLLSLQKAFSLLLVTMVVTTMQYSVASAQDDCPRMKPQTSVCSEYIKSYDTAVPQQVKVLDAVDAQLSYINLADGDVNNDKVSVTRVYYACKLL